MSKKGLSAEEKRIRLVDLFKETREFYKLQELEKLAPKLKGITAMSVKEMLQELVNDNLVKCEKVGIMNLYWHFPSDALASLTTRHTALTRSVTDLRSKLAQELEVVGQEEAIREGGEEREEKLQRLERAKERLHGLKGEEEQLADCDPRAVAVKEQQIAQLKASALQNTENVSAFLSYLANNFGAEARDQMREQLGIDEQWEEL